MGKFCSVGCVGLLLDGTRPCVLVGGAVSSLSVGLCLVVCFVVFVNLV